MNSDHPNFDFIMNPGKQGAGYGADAKKRRIITVLVGVVIILTLTLIVGKVISSTANKSNEQLMDLVAYQAELKRVIGLGVEKSRSSTTKNKAITATYTLESDYQQTAGIIRAKGIKTPKNLTARYAGGTSDQELDTADKANAFDAKYEELYKQKLTNYKVKLADIYPNLSPSEQAIIKKQNENAKLLLGEPLL